MSDEIQFFTDLEGTIPAKNGDRVALAKNLGGPGIDGRSVFPHLRPLLKDGYLWFDQTTDEIDRLRAENERLRAALRPFAEAADGFDATRIKNPEEWFAYRGIVSATEAKGAITVGDLRRARAALEGK